MLVGGQPGQPGREFGAAPAFPHAGHNDAVGAPVPVLQAAGSRSPESVHRQVGRAERRLSRACGLQTGHVCGCARKSAANRIQAYDDFSF
jgi:hypothetical protein